MPWLTIILLIFLFWFLIILYVSKKKYRIIRPYGPALMISTTRGKDYIEKWGKKSFWSKYGLFSIVLTLIFMVLTMALLFWEAILVIGLPKSLAPSPLAAIGLPGINPFIPITYGIVAIIVAVVLHELSHGLQSANNDINIKSMGILLFIVPIGAFVEPDEEKLTKSKRKIRMKVFSAGPSTNIVVSFVFLVLFILMVSLVSSPSNGALVTYSGNQSIKTGDLLLSIDGINVTSSSINYINIDPGKLVPLNLIRDSSIKQIYSISGLWVNNVLQGSPAYSAGIKDGEVLISINNILIRNYSYFNSFMENTTAGENIFLHFIFNGKDLYYNVTLIDKYKFYENYYPNYNSPSYKGKGFLGVSMAYMNSTFSDPKGIISMLSNPFSGGILQGFIFIITLPFIGLSPFPSYFQSVYLTPFSPILFWPIANIFYWIFWINLMLGLTNALPLLPLDGGYVLKDMISGLLERYKVMKNESIANGVSIALSLLVLFLILWQFIYPRIF
ncbi:MAG: peptidase M50 [Euryarchaeota archaeon]|nr:peptidase M50 [Euryarchaeota archaeon]